MKTINLFSVHLNPWLRQFPAGIPEWDGWRFVFNAENEDYDYLVVFDEIKMPILPRCNEKHIIHLSTEPPLVRHYSDEFLSQFAWTIRQGDRRDIEGAIYHHPGLNWHIGWRPGEENLDSALKFEQIKALFEQPKSKLISVIASNITISPQHKARLRFAQQLKQYYGEKIDFYGRGFVTMDDKIEALRDYRFHVVLENSSFDHYFSEKLTDCILAGTYPIYYGCPNLAEYFPQDSYQPIDIDNFEDAVKVIDNTIAQELDKKFRPKLLEARNLTLYEYNLFPMLINIIGDIEKGKYGLPNATQKIQNSVLRPLAQDVLPQINKLNKRVSIRCLFSKLVGKYKLFGLFKRIYKKIGVWNGA
ncbi:MAG: glycosyltransferase family 10 [Pseudomonadota bacterium]